MKAFSIAFVCTGNRFRSPLAEAFVRRLTLGLPVTTESFGTLELGNAPPLPEALEIGLSCGIALSGHRTRHLELASLENVDLLLGFEDAHVRHAVVDASAPRHRSFTLREIVRLVEAVKPLSGSDVVARARDAVEQAARSRTEGSSAGSSEDIVDPLGRPWSVYLGTAVEIRELSIRLVAALFGVDTSSGLLPVAAERSRTFLRRR